MVSDYEIQIKNKASKLLKYIRKSRQLTYDDLASMIGINRNSVKRIELNERSFKIEEYFLLCQTLDLPFELVFDDLCVIENKNDVESFKLPSSYKEDRYSHSGVVKIYSDFFISKLGSKTYDEFCKHRGVDKEYFYNRNNSINMRFIQHIVQYMTLKGVFFKKNAIDNFANYTAKKVNHLHLEEQEYNKLLTIPQIIGINEGNHHYEISNENKKNKTVDISYRPKDHVDLNLWKDDNLSGGFMDCFIKKVIPAICGINEQNTDLIRKYGSKKEKWSTVRVKYQSAT